MIYLRKLLCVAALFVASPLLAQATFPALTLEDLNGRALSFPQQLPGAPTIVFIAYKQRQQADIDAWVMALELQEIGGPAWIELPVVGRGAALIRPIIDNGMRSGIASPDMRARTFTVYTSRAAFNAAMGIADMRQIYVAVVAPDGTVRALIAGDVDEAKIARLRAAMG